MADPRSQVPSPDALWREAFAEFERVLDLELPARAAALEALEREQPELHRAVERLLAADDGAQRSGFMAAADAGPTLQADTTLGPYRLERRLGQGGMGDVWLAQRVDGLYQGRVAIKMLHPHLAVPAVRQRFAREGQLLGRLSHSNIARLLDAGTTADGLLYLVLEYVEGERLDQWCDRQRLAVRDRIRVFLEVCAAVAHAHAHLVVHRDLKPSNILVGADGGIKLLDFGIAKLIETEAGEGAEGELTRLGGRALTPEYAAPEQVRGEAVTTATDVYSLGVVLYRLLTGRSPYGATAVTAAQLERALLEAEPLALAEATRDLAPMHDAGDRAALRRSSVPALRRSLKGDLQNIVGKALRKRPAERYASVQALADDLQRYLRHEPVSARADALSYRAARFLRRHRLGLGAAALVLGAVIAGVAGVAWQAARAQAEARKANAVKEFLIGVFREADPDHSQGDTVTARALLEQGVRRTRTELAGEPRIQAELYETLARINSGLGQYPRAVALAGLALSLRRADPGAGRAELAASLQALGEAQNQQGEYGAARASFGEALELQRAAQGVDSLGVAEARSGLGLAEEGLGNRAVALALQAQAYEAFRRRLGDADVRTAEQSLRLAQRLEIAAQYPQAERQYRAALGSLVAALGAGHSRVGEVRLELGGLLDRMDRVPEADAELVQAIAILRRVYGDDHPQVAAALFSRALLLFGLKDYETARAALVETLRIHPPASYKAAQSHRYLGLLALEQRRWDEAGVELQAAMAGYRAIGGDSDVQAYRAQADLATARMRAGDPRAAEPMLRDAIAQLEQRVGAQAYEIRNPLKRLGENLLLLGQPAAAAAVLIRTRDLELRLFDNPDHQDLASTQHLLGRALLQQATAPALAQARVAADRALALARRQAGEALGAVVLLGAEVSLAEGDAGAARTGLDEAVLLLRTRRAQLAGAEPGLLADSSLKLAQALAATGTSAARGEALTLLDEALRLLAAANPRHAQLGAARLARARLQIDLGDRRQARAELALARQAILRDLGGDNAFLREIDALLERAGT